MCGTRPPDFAGSRPPDSRKDLFASSSLIRMRSVLRIKSIAVIPRPSLSSGRYLAAGWLETRRVRSIRPRIVSRDGILRVLLLLPCWKSNNSFSVAAKARAGDCRYTEAEDKVICAEILEIPLPAIKGSCVYRTRCR